MRGLENKFKNLLENEGIERNFTVESYRSNIRPTRNILELRNHINCLIYFKIRTEFPPKWGITKTRIDELKSLNKKWVIVLLYEQPDHGYLLTSADVERYLRENRWPIGNEKNKNEYKVNALENDKPSRSLFYHRLFKSFDEFLKILEGKLNSGD